MLILAHRVSALGGEPELVRIDPMVTNFASPFLALASEADLFVSVYRADLEDQELPGNGGRHLLVMLEQCQDIFAV